MMRWCSLVWEFLQRILAVLLRRADPGNQHEGISPDAPSDGDDRALNSIIPPHSGEAFPQPGGEILGVGEESEEEQEEWEEEGNGNGNRLTYGQLLGERIHELPVRTHELSELEGIREEMNILQRAIEMGEEVIREALHPFPYARENLKYETDDCPICRMPYSEGEEIAKLKCGHCQHFECIKQVVLRSSNSCVLCRAKVLDL